MASGVGAKIEMQLHKLIQTNSVILKIVRLRFLFYQMKVLISELLLDWCFCARYLLTKDELFYNEKNYGYVFLLKQIFLFSIVGIHTYLLLTLGVRLRIVLFSMLSWAMSVIDT